MINIGRFEKHLGLGEEIEIGGEKFLLKPLGTEHISNFLKAMRAFSGSSEGDSIGHILKNIDDEGLNSVRILIEATLKKSFPDETEEELRQFGLKYMSLLIGKIFEINSINLESIDDEAKKEMLDKLKRRREFLNK